MLVPDLEPEFDVGGYPTPVTIRKIRNWKIFDQASLDALWRFVRAAWNYPDYFSPRGDGTWHVSTGGWSGNEDLIRALQRNYLFWSLCWESGRRGGHHVFDLRLEGRVL